MESAIRTQDAEALWQAAHSLKTNNATVGAVRMAEICHELEVKGRGGRLDNSEQLLAELEKEFLYIENQLQVILKDRDVHSPIKT
jgi:HPt (histidine-containing phosphotransfer) domain-containing protein